MTDTDVVLLPPRNPNLNAHLERYMRSLKSECLDRIIDPGDEVGRDAGDVRCRERLGGMLRYYHERLRRAVQVRAVGWGIAMS